MKKIILVLACAVVSNFGIGMPEFFLTNIGSSVTNFAGKCVDPIVTSMINNPKLAVALIAGSGFYVNKYADYVMLTGTLSPLKNSKWDKKKHFSIKNLKSVLNVSKRTFDLVVSAPWKLLCIGQKKLLRVPYGMVYMCDGVLYKNNNERKNLQYCAVDFSGPDIGQVLTACSLFGLYYLLKTKEI